MMIVANWKAYVETTTKAKALVAAGKRLAAKGTGEIVLAPPAPYLSMVVGSKSSVACAAQDISVSTGGAATGEVTAALLSNLGVTHAILGHSERRAMGETNEIVLEKVQRALAHNITPIVCVGERERDTEAAYLHFLRTQLATIFAPLSGRERMQIIIAYEPVWAIGKSADESITPTDLGEMVLYIRKVLGDYLPGKNPDKVRILYGGSVEPGNIRALADGTGVDGFLIGHASVDVSTFGTLVKAVS